MLHAWAQPITWLTRLKTPRVRAGFHPCTRRVFRVLGREDFGQVWRTVGRCGNVVRERKVRREGPEGTFSHGCEGFRSRNTLLLPLLNHDADGCVAAFAESIVWTSWSDFSG